jgi:hypothetical protein
MEFGKDDDLLRGKTRAVYDDRAPGLKLPVLCTVLLTEQMQTWKELRDGYALLKEVRQRSLQCRGFTVLLQHNPGRMRSTTARVDEESTRRRPCFLCPDNLPEGQKGILYRNDYLILCNPMPVSAAHFTVSTLRHEPQGLEGNAAALLQLAADLGEGWAAMYNGPQCGASAPDHLHFQAMPAGKTPVEQEMKKDGAFAEVRRVGGAVIRQATGLGREVLLVEGDHAEEVGAGLSAIIAALKAAARTDAEPMMNIIALHADAQWRVIIFPRARHRPEAFFAEGDAQVLVSPAVMEMAGLVVTPQERDFRRLTAAVVEAIYREVSQKRDIVEAALHDIEKFAR